MGVVMIPLALLAGWLLGYPDEVVITGTTGALVVRFVLETIQDCLEEWL